MVQFDRRKIAGLAKVFQVKTAGTAAGDDDGRLEGLDLCFLY